VQLKHRLLKKAPKTVNNILTVLNVMLKKAVEWEVIERLPCTIKVSKGSTRFYDFDDFERLVVAAAETGPRAYVLALLAGDAELPLGEVVALEWSDIDFAKGQMCVQQSAWKRQVASTKADDCDTCDWLHGSPLLFGTTDICAVRECCIKMMVPH
jgi:integrase